MTIRRIVTREVRAKQPAFIPAPEPTSQRQRIARVVPTSAGHFVELDTTSGHDARREPIRRDTSTSPSDIARSALWSSTARKLDGQALESLVSNAMALSHAVRVLAGLVTARDRDAGRVRDALREAHARSVDCTLGIELVREVLR